MKKVTSASEKSINWCSITQKITRKKPLYDLSHSPEALKTNIIGKKIVNGHDLDFDQDHDAESANRKCYINI